MTITINKHTIIYFVLIAVIVIGGYMYVIGPNKELDLYKTEHEKDIKIRNDKFHSDSVALVVRYNNDLRLRDSTLAVSEKEVQKQMVVINYYKTKIKNVQTMPISAVDHQLDSLFSARHQ